MLAQEHNEDYLRPAGNPKDSRARLLQLITSKPNVSLDEILEFESQDDIWFGAGKRAIHVLTELRQQGDIALDFERREVRVQGIRFTPKGHRP